MGSSLQVTRSVKMFSEEKQKTVKLTLVHCEFEQKISISMIFQQKICWKLGDKKLHHDKENLIKEQITGSDTEYHKKTRCGGA